MSTSFRANDIDKLIIHQDCARVILGVLVTWVQTKVRLKVSKKDGKTTFEFEMSKDAAGTEVIKELARSLMTLLRGS